VRWPDARPGWAARWSGHPETRAGGRRIERPRTAGATAGRSAGSRRAPKSRSRHVCCGCGPLISTPEARGSTPRSRRFAQLAADPGPFDPEVLRALQQCYSTAEAEAPRQVTLDELRAGMVVLEEVMNARGTVLVGRGSVITARMIERLRNYAESDHDLGPIIVSSTAVA